jgi:hypothetical protein
VTVAGARNGPALRDIAIIRKTREGAYLALPAFIVQRMLMLAIEPGISRGPLAIAVATTGSGRS